MHVFDLLMCSAWAVKARLERVLKFSFSKLLSVLKDLYDLPIFMKDIYAIDRTVFPSMLYVNNIRLVPAMKRQRFINYLFMLFNTEYSTAQKIY